jgi:hypothetical protein
MIEQSILGGWGGLLAVIFLLYEVNIGVLAYLQLFAAYLKPEYCTIVPIEIATHGREDRAAKSYFEEGCIA